MSPRLPVDWDATFLGNLSEDPGTSGYPAICGISGGARILGQVSQKGSIPINRKPRRHLFRRHRYHGVPATIRQCPGATEDWTGRPGLRGPFGVYGFVRFPSVFVYTKPPRFARRFGVYDFSVGNARIRIRQRGPGAPAGLSSPLWPQGSGV